MLKGPGYAQMKAEAALMRAKYRPVEESVGTLDQLMGRRLQLMAVKVKANTAQPQINFG